MLSELILAIMLSIIFAILWGHPARPYHNPTHKPRACWSGAAGVSAALVPRSAAPNVAPLRPLAPHKATALKMFAASL